MGMKMKVSPGAGLLAVGIVLLGAVEIWRGGWNRGEIPEQSLPWLIIATAAMIHELGHVVAAASLGVGIRGMNLDLFGARLELGGLLSYGIDSIFMETIYAGRKNCCEPDYICNPATPKQKTGAQWFACRYCAKSSRTGTLQNNNVVHWNLKQFAYCAQMVYTGKSGPILLKIYCVGCC